MSYKHFFETLKPDLQETAQNFEKHVLQKCLRITCYTYKPMNPFHFLKKHQNRCTLIDSQGCHVMAACPDEFFLIIKVLFLEWPPIVL
jgi:hypothetical protein